MCAVSLALFLMAEGKEDKTKDQVSHFEVFRTSNFIPF